MIEKKSETKKAPGWPERKERSSQRSENQLKTKDVMSLGDFLFHGRFVSFAFN